MSRYKLLRPACTSIAHLRWPLCPFLLCIRLQSGAPLIELPVEGFLVEPLDRMRQNTAHNLPRVYLTLLFPLDDDFIETLDIHVLANEVYLVALPGDSEDS